MGKYKCPCCGNYSLDFPSGQYDICDICNWEDDPIQRDDPDYTGGANRMSLNEAKENYSKFGTIYSDNRS